jgi:hypothetical protein
MTVFEQIIDGMYSAEAGKVVISLERFADGLEAIVRVYDGAAPIYNGFVESRGFASNNLLDDRPPGQHFSFLGETIRAEVEKLQQAVRTRHASD